MVERLGRAGAFRLDDPPLFGTGIEPLDRVQALLAQRILRNNELLLDAKIRVACIDPVRGKPVPMPRTLHENLSALSESTR